MLSRTAFQECPVDIFIQRGVNSNVTGMPNALMLKIANIDISERKGIPENICQTTKYPNGKRKYSTVIEGTWKHNGCIGRIRKMHGHGYCLSQVSGGDANGVCVHCI